MSKLQEQLSWDWPDLPWQFDLPLASKTYFKTGGPAEAYLSISTPETIAEIAAYAHEHDVPITVLGGASNVLVADDGISGIVLSVTADYFTVLEEGEMQGTIEVGAGLKTALLVRKSVDAGFAGLEYFLGVPGTVGGAVYNNAHYLESLIGEYVDQVYVYQPEQGLVWLEHDELEFGYDTSRFHRTNEVLIAVQFVLPKGNAEESMAKIAEATRYRATTQPLGEPSSGCIFQNVPNTDHLRKQFPQFADRTHVPGGFLIDKAGLKGEHEGDIYVSDVHAAFFVNKGQGTTADVKKLVQRVKETVKQKFDVDLQEEVFYLG